MEKRKQYRKVGQLLWTPFGDAVSLLSAIAIASNTESPGQITIPDSAMAVALAREIKVACKSPQMTIIYPPLFGRGSSSDFASADIQLYIQRLDDIRSIAQKVVDDANTAYVAQHASQKVVTEQTKITTVTPCKKDKNQTQNRTSSQSGPTTTVTPCEKDTNQTDKTCASETGSTTTTGSTATTGDAVLTAALADINGLSDSFMNSLLQVNPNTGVSGSASVIQGYQLAMLLKGNSTRKNQLLKIPQSPPQMRVSIIRNGSRVQHSFFEVLPKIRTTH